MEYVGPPDDPHAHSTFSSHSSSLSLAFPIICYNIIRVLNRYLPLALPTLEKTIDKIERNSLKRKNHIANVHERIKPLEIPKIELPANLTIFQNPIKKSKCLKPLPIS